MKVLIVTAMYPTPENPAWGSFIHTQVESLRRSGVEMEVLVFEGRPRKLAYLKGLFQLHQRLAQAAFDLVPAHYGFVRLVARAPWSTPMVVPITGTICWHDRASGSSNTEPVTMAP